MHLRIASLVARSAYQAYHFIACMTALKFLHILTTGST